MLMSTLIVGPRMDLSAVALPVQGHAPKAVVRIEKGVTTLLSIHVPDMAAAERLCAAFEAALIEPEAAPLSAAA
jgi:hypothetical protein